MAARRFLFLLAALSLAFAPAPLPRHQRQSKPTLALYGHWKGPKRMVITPTHMTFPDSPGYPYTLRVDPNANPPAFDIFGIAGTSSAGRNFKGIYRVEGDRLTLLYNAAESGRPKDINGSGIREQFTRSSR